MSGATEMESAGRTPDHTEIDLGGSGAAVSDRGLRHHRNEDAFATAAHPPRVAVVVCDGVSSTANPDLASAAAAAAAIEILSEALTGPGESIGDALRDAVGAAQSAGYDVDQEEPGGPAAAPSTTLVAAVAEPGLVRLVSIGDSRAYWISPSGSRVLTVDDSFAEEAVSSGIPAEDAYSSPHAHVITRWLGADSPDTEAEVVSFSPDSDGTLLVCTDGLWNYFESADSMEEMLAGTDDETPLGVARHLVKAALAAGGHDNVTVAVVPVPS